MTEHRAVAAEQEAKSSRNDADFSGNISAILDLVFCTKEERRKRQRSFGNYVERHGSIPNWSVLLPANSRLTPCNLLGVFVHHSRDLLHTGDGFHTS